jgi:hypothetical protein
MRKARPVLIDPTKVGSLVLDRGNLSLLQLGVFLIILRKLLAFVIVGGGHGASKTENSSWQKQIETKTR